MKPARYKNTDLSGYTRAETMEWMLSGITNKVLIGFKNHSTGQNPDLYCKHAQEPMVRRAIGLERAKYYYFAKGTCIKLTSETFLYR